MVAEEDPPKCRKCVGLLYFSSRRVSQARNPLCVGLSRAERKGSLVKHYTKGVVKSDPQALLYFKYVCVGYSLHEDVKVSSSTFNVDERQKLPLCVGLEILAKKRTPRQGGHHRHANKTEDPEDNEASTITKAPPSAILNPSSTRTVGSKDFSARFIRNAGLVAGAVKKDLSRVGNSIKAAAMDIFHSDRNRPK